MLREKGIDQSFHSGGNPDSRSDLMTSEEVFYNSGLSIENIYFRMNISNIIIPFRDDL